MAGVSDARRGMRLRSFEGLVRLSVLRVGAVLLAAGCALGEAHAANQACSTNPSDGLGWVFRVNVGGTREFSTSRMADDDHCAACAANPGSCSPGIPALNGQVFRYTARDSSGDVIAGQGLLCTRTDFGTGWAGGQPFKVANWPCDDVDDPPPPECDANHPNVGKRFSSVDAMGGCDSESNCRIDRSTQYCFGGFDGAEGCFDQYVVTNQQCSPGQEDSEVPPPSETCVTSAAGNELCSADGGDSCGWFNDEFVCFKRIESDGCQAMQSGGRLCGPDAPVPPVPDNGTPGQPAPPDDVVNIENNITNYYNNTTVSNSHRPPNSSGDNPYDGDDGSGTSPAGGSGGDGGGAGEGLTCDPSTDSGCTEDGEGGDPDDDPRGGWSCWADGEGFSGAVQQCFSSAAQTLYSTLIADSSLLNVAVLTADAVPSGGGSCPSDVFTIPFVGESYDAWEVPCMFLSDVESILGPLFLFGWSLIGLRILLSIPGGE